MNAAGSLAYLDSFAGLVPVRVTAVTKTGVRVEITAEVTETRGPYAKGEVLTRGTLSIVPREAIRRTKYNTYIRPYTWTVDAPQQE